MKSIECIKLSTIARGAAIAFGIATIWTIVFFTLGLSSTTTEVNSYILYNKKALTLSIIEGDLVNTQSILVGLEKYGVESSTINTSIFWGNQQRTIYSGRLDRSALAYKYNMQIIDNGLYLGELNYRISPSKIFRIVLRKQWQVLTILIFSNLFILVLINSVLIAELRAIQNALTTSIRKGLPLNDKLVTTNPLSRLLFSRDLGVAIRLMINDMIELRKQEITLSRIKNEKAVARQIAHDIRAPISAINAASKKLSGPDEAFSLLELSVQRINSIANDLLKKGNDESSFGSDITITTKDHLLKNVNNHIHHIVAETKARFSMVKIEFNSAKFSNYDTISVDINVLSRMISILVTNAAESATTDHAYVDVSIYTEANILTIKIEDNGCGIPQHILNRIGEVGLSYGKKDGHGLGLNYVSRAATKMNVDFKIDSFLSKGTCAFLRVNLNENKLNRFSEQAAN